MARVALSRAQALNMAPISRTSRVPRSPQHTFITRQRPFEITPFFIAPVLPGETLKNILFQARAVTDPIKSPLLGWHAEYYFFYVKHRDLDARDILTSMMLDPSTDVSSLRDATGTAWTYTFDDGIDWVTPCLKRVVEEYFRDEGEAWNTYVITAGRPAARINGNSWLDSVVDATTILDPIDQDLVVGGDDTITASEIDATLRHWEFLSQNAMINMSYEDWLATYGVRPAAVELHRPELIRYVRDWKYPSNMVAPDATPRVAVSWQIQERADKDRFLKEPGFIFGVSVFRPKVYLQNQTGAGVGMMDDAYAWLPAIMADDPRTSLKEFTTSNGPLQSTTNPYQVDIKDLLVHGDQFVNFALNETDANIIGLPNAALTNKMYPASADADELFSAASPANQIRSDGIVKLTILGRTVDTT